MDLAILTTLFALAIICAAALVGSVYAGSTGMVILGSLALIGFIFIPATPIIPLWLGLLIVLSIVIFIAYRIAKIFGFGGGSAE